MLFIHNKTVERSQAKVANKTVSVLIA